VTRLGRTIIAAQIPLERFASQLPEGAFRDGMSRMMAHYDKHGLPTANHSYCAQFSVVNLDR
jgi:hypothetical protein